MPSDHVTKGGECPELKPIGHADEELRAALSVSPGRIVATTAPWQTDFAVPA
jgi:hypothetical protein